jgi:hypothetical protein
MQATLCVCVTQFMCVSLCLRCAGVCWLCRCASTKSPSGCYMAAAVLLTGPWGSNKATAVLTPSPLLAN